MVKYEFSKKTFKKEIYKKAIDDYIELLETLDDNDNSFSKLKRDIFFMRDCGKGEYDFDYQSLTLTAINNNGKIKIKTIRVFDINTDEFLCYMKIKGKQNE